MSIFTQKVVKCGTRRITTLRASKATKMTKVYSLVPVLVLKLLITS
ncbi:hypothetical protein VEx25_0434 [Vibrio antiquarius]|uniref:Uncharacterized protein n=1 Tax=Vibrio antiquarius (strain Ex25) TaxID=150340 RepID=A0ABM9WWA0_VIBAE|nr:hypothetical protein VEx25_0434 [Vibrio antiquarius]